MTLALDVPKIPKTPIRSMGFWGLGLARVTPKAWHRHEDPPFPLLRLVTEDDL